MDDEIPEQPPTGRRPSNASLSRTPSWVLLGFLLGAGFMWLLPSGGQTWSLAGRPEAPAAPVVQPSPAAAPAPVAPKVPTPRVLSTVEAVFERYGKHAVWDHDITQVALWNPERDSFSDCYEVRRENGELWFRSIPLLTRPMLALPDNPEVPLVFTETEALRREREEARARLVPARSETVTPADRKPKVEMPRP